MPKGRMTKAALTKHRQSIKNKIDRYWKKVGTLRSRINDLERQKRSVEEDIKYNKERYDSIGESLREYDS